MENRFPTNIGENRKIVNMFRKSKLVYRNLVIFILALSSFHGYILFADKLLNPLPPI